MKYYRALLFVVLCALTQFTFAQRGVRLAYIDMDEILENVDEYSTASSLLEKNVEEWKKDIEVRKMELQGREEQLQAEKVLLTQELIEDRQRSWISFEKKLSICKINTSVLKENTSNKRTNY